MFDDLNNRVKISTGVVSTMRGFAWKATITLYANNQDDLLKQFDNIREEFKGQIYEQR